MNNNLEKEMDRIEYGKKEYEEFKKNNYELEVPEEIENQIEKCFNEYKKIVKLVNKKY